MCGGRTKKKAIEKLEGERVVYLNDIQREAYVLSIIDQRIAVPAFGPGPSLGPECPRRNQIEAAIFAKKNYFKQVEVWRPLFDSLPIHHDLALNGNSWPLGPCENSQTLIFALRGGVLLA